MALSLTPLSNRNYRVTCPVAEVFYGALGGLLTIEDTASIGGEVTVGSITLDVAHE